MKKCPRCKMEVYNSAEQCSACMYLFPDDSKEPAGNAAPMVRSEFVETPNVSAGYISDTGKIEPVDGEALAEEISAACARMISLGYDIIGVELVTSGGYNDESDGGPYGFSYTSGAIVTGKLIAEIVTHD